jgi:anthranilate synthase component 1
MVFFDQLSFGVLYFPHSTSLPKEPSVQKPDKRRDGVIKVIPGERYTPFSLAEILGAQVILESSSYKKGRERYSLLMIKEAFRLTQEADAVYLHKGGKKLLIKSTGKDILDIMMYFSRQQPDPGQDFPFPAGGIGYLTYEFSRYCDKIKFQDRPDPLGLPDALFLFGHIFVVFDHYTDLIYLLGLNYHEAEIDLEAALGEIEDKLARGPGELPQDGPKTYPSTVVSPGYNDEEAYMKGVQKVREEIIKGNLLQGVLSRRMTVETEMPALEAYRNLRSSNPSPYLFYYDFGEYQLFGSSPEVHVKVHEGVAHIRPIAGTRRRGKDEKEDKALEQELLADEKERAEHLMLIDLARNDLGRVCQTRSVVVKDYYTIERYSHVMHIVSSVDGTLKEELPSIQGIRATIPAGTVSGAPKIQAIETLSELEPVQRRFYAGVVGYVGTDNNLDTAIAIRCALKMGKKMILQAGAGIVYDSTPERELEETKEKLRALGASIGLEV